ncbi:adenosine receptor A3 [Nematostella vectensis]|uniref:adenosine receptor A3 n=1 Tax=Nematostella vectensis TaxID=45351 RepID=UPI0020778E23|nr:adenosine receptor A3 [Nematostella vectensis]
MSGTTSGKPNTNTIAIAVFLGEGTLGAVANVLTLIVFITNRTLRKRSAYFIASLALADALVGIAAICLAVFIALGHDTRAVLAHQVPDSFACSAFQVYATVSSGLGLLTIAIERFFATMFPFRYRVSRMYPYYFGFAFQLLCSSSAIVALLISVDVFNIFVKYLIACTLPVICLCYAAIFVKFKLQNRQHGRQALPQTQQRERNMAKTLVTATSISLLCCVPTVIIVTDVRNTEAHVVLACYCIRFANSLVNPVIFTLRMDGFKKVLVKFLCCTRVQLHPTNGPFVVRGERVARTNNLQDTPSRVVLSRDVCPGPIVVLRECVARTKNPQENTSRAVLNRDICQEISQAEVPSLSSCPVTTSL